MDATIFEATIKNFCKRAPFKPFIVEMSSGGQVVVEHPEAMICRGGTAVYLDTKESITFLDHDHVTRVMDSSAMQAA